MCPCTYSLFTGAAFVWILLCIKVVVVTWVCASEGCPEISKNASDPAVPVITDESTVDDVMLYSHEQPLTLGCCVRGHPKPNVTWMRDSKPLVISPRLQLTNDDQELRFDRVLPEDSGEYMCIAENNHGSTNYTIYMDIRIEPGRGLPPRVDMNNSWSVTAGSNVTLVCHAYSTYSTVVFWTKGQNITINKSNLLKDTSLDRYTSSLTITNASSKDAGIYSCHAKNGIGDVVQKTGRLTVIEKEGETLSPKTAAPETAARETPHEHYVAAVGGGLALLAVTLFILALVYVKRCKPQGWATRKLIKLGVVKPPECHAEAHGEDGDDDCSCSVIWDVFISYDDKDRGWVMDKLHKQLTTEYKVCIDCPTSAADDVARRIWRSKTTLFVVSRDFLKSGWSNSFDITQDKIRRAQGVLIVIMLEEIKWQELPPILRKYATGKVRVDCKEKQLQPQAWRRLKSLLGPSIDHEEIAEETSEEKYRLVTTA